MKKKKEKQIIGIDPSWNGFHMYGNQFYGQSYSTFSKSIQLDPSNLTKTVATLKKNLHLLETDLYVVEDFSLRSFNTSTLSMGKLRGLLDFVLEQSLCGKVIYVAPTTLKKFVTGKGNAQKDLIMQQVYKKYDFEARNSNEADSFGLWQIGDCLFNGTPTLNIKQDEVINLLNKKYESTLKGVLDG